MVLSYSFFSISCECTREPIDDRIKLFTRLITFAQSCSSAFSFDNIELIGLLFLDLFTRIHIFFHKVNHSCQHMRFLYGSIFTLGGFSYLY